MAGNPLVSQGTLNRIRGSIIIPNFPNLNVTASFLGEEGISLSLDGESTVYMGTLTGAVTSPEPYMMITAKVNLLKTQSLAASYKAQMEALSLIGDMTVIPDATTLPNYSCINCSIGGVEGMSFAGKNANFTVTLRGYYIVNNSLFDPV